MCKGTLTRNPLYPQYYLKRGFTEKEAIEQSIKVQNESGFFLKNGGFVKVGWASKASLKVFIPLYKWMRKSGFIIKSDVKLGVRGSMEYSIETEEAYYLYDFSILNLKIIIEYNGPYHVKMINDVLQYNHHPHKIKESEAYNLYFRELEKIQAAENLSFKVLVIWYDISPQENLEICKRFILENI